MHIMSTETNDTARLSHSVMAQAILLGLGLQRRTVEDLQVLLCGHTYCICIFLKTCTYSLCEIGSLCRNSLDNFVQLKDS